MSDPARIAASTISTPPDKPAISLFRYGKFAERAGVPSGHSEIIAPSRAISCASVW